MQTHIATIVPADTREDAIETATTVFETLTTGGDNPTYTSYTLFSNLTDPTGNEKREGAHPLDSSTGETVIDSLWTTTITDLEIVIETTTGDSQNSNEPNAPELTEPTSIAYARAHHIYDDVARPILTKRQLSTVRQRDDRWVVQAFAEY